MLKSAQAGARRRSFFMVFLPNWPRSGGVFFYLCFYNISHIFAYINAICGVMMDTTKWKSVLVPIEVYSEIKKIAKAEGRTISGQLRIIFDTYKRSQKV
jgi:hypothetical protein